MHKIGVISDTHGLLRQETMDILQGCDVILHGGDINHQGIIDTLKDIAPTYVVRGNNDKAWAERLPETISLELFGIRFFMVHNKREVPKDIAGIDVVIYGHSHQYAEYYIGEQLWLNPGSCGPRRFRQPVTMAVLEIVDKHIMHVNKIDLLQQAATAMGAEQGGSNELPRNLKQVIQSVIKDTDRGICVNEIAVRNGIHVELAEQICRLYLTHPGVSADGIMTKMGL